MSRTSKNVTAQDFARLNASLGLSRRIKGLDYVRCLEFPLVYNHLDLEPGMRLLDVGSRTSIFPLFIAHRDPVEMHATDLDPLVEALPALAARIPGEPKGKLVVKQADLRSLPYPDDHFDRITNISVIEHVPDPGDIEGMKDLARVLKPGGKLILTTPFSATAKDFHLNETVYSEEFKGEPVFFQRHYTDETVRTRLVEPTGLREEHRAYFGEPGMPFFNKWWVLPGPLKALKALYAWRAPAISAKYLRVVSGPGELTLQSPPMITANGIFLILTKDA